MKYLRSHNLLSLVFFLSAFTLQACTSRRVLNVKELETVVSSVDEVLQALKAAKPGDVILVKSGDYKFQKRIDIQVDGSEKLPIVLISHKNNKTRPIFDFSALGEGNSNQGIILRASYWEIKGIEVTKAGDNGILINGNNNLIENCSFSQCSDTGLQLDSHAANNLILNCDSYFNADSKIENADGFACKIDVGSGNKFKGCRAWQNLDDGWDGYLKQTDNVSTVFEDCWAFSNGILKNGQLSGGDGNGFKSGGSDNKLLKHNATYTNCVSAGNVKNGFDHNSNRGEVTLIGCKAYDNKQKNLSFGKKNPVSKLTVKDCIVLGTPGSLEADLKEISGNNWQLNQNLQPDNFISLEISELKKPRKADGSLPDINFMKVK
ncbi:right-handed parallel beta-helix repeat-containing protein [Desertivirga xinjiangensis]|uniref:right-handed parallel beta-helix repeat-containing protein n=1 Tax=Desertivirga xinjiangensis TaxID=539206 RepID=UPI00210B664B|nr:right-handed parallel beta-helix repeat-containing protein [Pedobacter xinjiangensis]